MQACQLMMCRSAADPCWNAASSLDLTGHVYAATMPLCLLAQNTGGKSPIVAASRQQQLQMDTFFYMMKSLFHTSRLQHWGRS